MLYCDFHQVLKGGKCEDYNDPFKMAQISKVTMNSFLETSFLNDHNLRIIYYLFSDISGSCVCV